MSNTEAGWETVLVKAGVHDAEERRRLSRALTMAQKGIATAFADRIDYAAVDYHEYSSSERRMPLLLWTTYDSDEGYYSLKRELAEKVLGPVLRETGISMPPFVMGRETLEEPSADSADIGILYPAAA